MKISVAPEYRGSHFLKVVAALSGLLCAVAGAPAASIAGSPATEFVRIDNAASPSFTLPDTAGAEVALSAARGDIVLVHFFATWCEPCREELPALNRLAAQSKGRVKVLAISVAEVDIRVRRFLDTVPLDFPVLLDRDRAVAKTWNVSTLPTTFVLDPNLRPHFVVETDFAWDSIDAARLAGMMAARTKTPDALSNDHNTPKSTLTGG